MIVVVFVIQIRYQKIFTFHLLPLLLLHHLLNCTDILPARCNRNVTVASWLARRLAAAIVGRLAGWRGLVGLGGQQFEQRRAVARGLGFADAGDVEQFVGGLRPARGEFVQRAVVQDDVGGHALFAGGLAAPLAQGVEQAGVGGGLAARGLGATAFGFAAFFLRSACRRSISVVSPFSTGRAASVSLSAP